MKKIFVVTDIHGHFTILKEALDRTGFDEHNEDHVLVCCGDYFDRGCENVQVYNYFNRLKNKILLRGNHEDMLLKLLYTGKILPHHRINGTVETLNDFFGKYSVDMEKDSFDITRNTSTINDLCRFIESTVDYFETENYVFVHGWFPKGFEDKSKRNSFNYNSWETARKEKWTVHYKGERPIRGKTLICGHVPTFFKDVNIQNLSELNSEIFFGNGFIALDAGTFDSKRINVLVIEDNI